MNLRPSNASRATAAVNTEYGAGQLTSHATMTDPDDAVTPISDIVSAMQPPPMHLIAQLSSVHCSHVSARTSQHGRSVHPPSATIPIAAAALAVQFNPASMRSRSVRTASPVPRDLTEPSKFEPHQ